MQTKHRTPALQGEGPRGDEAPSKGTRPPAKANYFQRYLGQRVAAGTLGARQARVTPDAGRSGVRRVAHALVWVTAEAGLRQSFRSFRSFGEGRLERGGAGSSAARH